MEMGEELQEILTRDDATIQQQSVTDPYTDSDIIRAAHMVHDVIHSLPPRKEGKISDRLFSMIYSRQMFVIKYAVIALHMALVFALDRPPDYTSPSDNDSALDTLNRRLKCKANSNSRHEAWVLPLEVLFSLFYAALCACSIACIKYNRSRPWRMYLSISESIVVVALFLDSVMAITKSNVAQSGVQIRFGVPLRPVLVILWSSRVREIISEVVQSCRSLKYMAILIVSWLVISSLFFVQSVRFECGLGDADRPHLFPQDRKEACRTLMLHFDNSLVGLVSGLVLSTGEMYTVITLPLFDIPDHALDFAVVVSWTIITYFILMAIVLAIIFNAYKEAKRATLVKQSDTLDGRLFDAFEIIANPQNHVIGYDVYAKFLGYFQVAFPLPCVMPTLTIMQPGINSKTIKLYWSNHNKVKVGGTSGIEVNEFVELGSILKYKIKKFRTDGRFLKWAKKQGRIGNGLEFVRTIVKTNLFTQLSQILLLLNLIMMFIQNALPSNSRDYISIFEYRSSSTGDSLSACDSQAYPGACRALYHLDIVELVLFLLFGVEMIFRVLSYGLSGACKFWIIFDGFIFLSGCALYISQYSSKALSVDLSPGTLSTLRVFRVIRMLRFFRFSTSLQVLFNTMTSVLPGVWRFASVVSLIMYAYAGLGMILMQCSGVNSEHSNTVNFDSMFGSMIIMYQLLTTDSWDSQMWSAYHEHGFTLWISLYFLSYYLLVTIILRTLLLALIVETYDANLSLSAEQNQFTLSPNINQDEDDSQEQKEDDMQLFLQYDREQLILARIASFDSDAHRLAHMEMLKQQLAKNGKSHNMEAAGDAGVSTRASLRVQLSEAIKDGLRGSVGADSSDTIALRRLSSWNAGRGSVGRGSVSGVETDVLLPLIRRCVFVAEYPGNVNALVARALLCVSEKPNFAYTILTDLEDCIEILDNFGFQISVASSPSMMASLCAAALALMNQQAPPLPPSSGGVFAVKIVLRACTLLQAAIRRSNVQKNAAVSGLVLQQPEPTSSGMRAGLLHHASV